MDTDQTTPPATDLATIRNADSIAAQTEQTGATRTPQVDLLVRHRRQLLAEVDRLTGHSVTLNTIGWRIADVLGDVPAGATQVEGEPLEQADRLIAQLAEARELLDSLVDEDECSFDHHGGCQAHGYLSLEAGEKCPNQAAKDLLSAATPSTQPEESR